MKVSISAIATFFNGECKCF